MIHVNQYFPFTPDSTRIIFDDVEMPLGLVYGALIYPRLPNTTALGALHISNMYTRFTNDGVEHHWTVTNEFEDITLDVLFPTYDVKQGTTVVMPKGLIDEGPSTGYVLQHSFCRGVIRCAKGFLSYVENLPVMLELQPDAFVFDATTVRYRQNAGFQEIYFEGVNGPIKEIKFDSKDFQVVDGVTVPIAKEAKPNILRTHVKKLKFGSDTITATEKVQNVSIVSKKNSGVKVSTDGSSVIIGRSTDVL